VLCWACNVLGLTCAGDPGFANGVMGRGLGVWSGVKIGCGMFIVLPILIILAFVIMVIVLGSLGSAGG
jgi:hypothetical protein